MLTEKEHNIHVNAKTYVGGDQMFALFTQSKATYDVVVVDPEYLHKLHVANRLSPLNAADYDFSQYYEPFHKLPMCWIDGELFAVVVRFGVNGLVYNTERLTYEDVKSYQILWDPKVKGKVGVQDWYLLTMGNISKALGNENPYDITDEGLRALEQRLRDLRPQLAGIYTTPPEILSAFANEEIWVVQTGGEFVVRTLKQQGEPIDWTVPQEGGTMWIETLVVPNDAPHPDTARLFIQWAQTAEAQALLVRRRAYASNAPNKGVLKLLPQADLEILKTRDEMSTLELIRSLSIRRLPQNQTEAEWQRVWEEFKQMQPQE